jgi:site-specific DNA recombinase
MLVDEQYRQTPSLLSLSQSLVKIAQAMFKKAWEVRLQQSQMIKKSLESKNTEIERQIEQLVDRIVDTTSPSTIAAYERRIEKLEREKLIAVEKLRSDTEPKRTYEEMFELALVFLANPWKLWASDRLEDKRTVLKLAFSERLAFDRKTGLRTPQVSEPFRFLRNFSQKCEMVRPTGFEPVASGLGILRSILLSYGRITSGVWMSQRRCLLAVFIWRGQVYL